EKLGLSDDETVLAITENPYLQYFIGLHVFQEKAPFDPSSMTHFRKRFDADFINNLNERIVREQQEAESQNHSKDRSEEHTSELQSRFDLVCRLLLEKKKTTTAKESTKKD